MQRHDVEHRWHRDRLIGRHGDRATAATRHDDGPRLDEPFVRWWLVGIRSGNDDDSDDDDGTHNGDERFRGRVDVVIDGSASEGDCLEPDGRHW